MNAKLRFPAINTLILFNGPYETLLYYTNSALQILNMQQVQDKKQATDGDIDFIIPLSDSVAIFQYALPP